MRPGVLSTGGSYTFSWDKTLGVTSYPPVLIIESYQWGGPPDSFEKNQSFGLPVQSLFPALSENLQNEEAHEGKFSKRKTRYIVLHVF